LTRSCGAKSLVKNLCAETGKVADACALAMLQFPSGNIAMSL
jgi:hypothetical protein